MPDPDVKVGSWIADVTYERQATVSANKFTYIYPGQRIYWYQIAKRTEPVDDPGFASDPKTYTYRQMTVWTTSPWLSAKVPSPW